MQRQTVLNDKAIPVFGFDPEDPRCIITSAILFKPVVTGCGHVFEKEAIEQWKATKPKCPCCNGLITSLAPAPASVLQAVDAYLSKKPGELYYSDGMLDQAMVEQNPKEIKKLIQFFIANPGALNKISENNMNPSKRGNYLPIFRLASRDGGELLLDNANLRNAIDSNALNYIVPGEDESVVFWLTAKPEGQQWLIKDAKLRDKIEAKALNQIVSAEGIDKNRSPVFYLLATEEGRKLLLNDAVLRNKISGATLNAALNHVISSKDEFNGKTLLTMLSQYQTGQQLLLETEIQNKLSLTNLKQILAAQEKTKNKLENSIVKAVNAKSKSLSSGVSKSMRTVPFQSPQFAKLGGFFQTKNLVELKQNVKTKSGENVGKATNTHLPALHRVPSGMFSSPLQRRSIARVSEAKSNRSGYSF